MAYLKSLRVKALVVATSALLAISGAPSQAQSIVQPAAVQAVDANGVNLANGKFIMPGLDIEIGDSRSGIARQTQGDTDNFSGVMSTSTIPVAYSGSGTVINLQIVNASYGGQTYRFVTGVTDSPVRYYQGPYKQYGGGSATLTCNSGTGTYDYTIIQTDRTGTCTLTLEDGTTVLYDRTKTSGASAFGPMTSITRPNGEAITLTYYEVTTSGVTAVKAVKIVNSSLGWALKYEVDSAYKVVKVTAVNTSVTRCDSASCAPDYTYPAVSQTWDGTNGTISHNDMLSATNPLVKLLDYTIASGTTTLKSPNGVKRIINTYSSGTFTGRVSSVVVGGQTWSYGYVLNTTTGATTTTVTEPNLKTRQLVVSYDGAISATVDEEGRTTTYSYDSASGHIMSVIPPDGNTLSGPFTLYGYDSTGRLTSRTVVPKNGASNSTPNAGAAIITSATYVACDGTNAAKCMQPATATDANGQTTTFSYDAQGNLRSVVAPPSVTSGPRLATFYTYTPITPKVQTAGGLVDSLPVSRLTATKVCEVLLATSSSCDSTNTPAAVLWTETDEIYDVDAGYTGVGKNATPIAAIVKRGDNTTTTVRTDVLYNKMGQIIYSYGPKASDDASTDLTQKEKFTFYDRIGRPVGSTGPAPDGSTSTLKRKATRITYNTDRQVITQEAGIVPTLTYAGSTPTDKWAAANTEWSSGTGMTVLEKSTIEYSPPSATLPGFAVRTRHFAALGVTGSTLEDAVTEQSYDNMGRISCKAERLLDSASLHNLVTNVPDACTKSSVGPDGPDRIVRYTYDDLGQILSVSTGVDTTSAVRAEVTNVYSDGTANSTDPAGNLIPKGVLISSTDAKSNKTAFGYDNFDRLVTTWYPSKTVPGSLGDYTQATYSGERVGSTKLRDNQTITYTYDNLGRVLNTTGAVVESMTYDTFGNVLTHDNASTGGAAANAIYTYNAMGSMLTAKFRLGSATQRSVSYEYNSYNQRTKMTWPDNFYVTYGYYLGGAPHYIRDSANIYIARVEYDAYDRRFRKKLGSGSPYPAQSTLTFDSTQRVSSLTNDLDGPHATTTWDNTYTFGYTVADQLKSKTVSNTASFSQPVPVFTTTSYATNGQNQITTSNSVSYSYDSRGNMSTDGSATYTYNSNNLLTQVVASGATTNLAYDAENRLARVAKAGMTEHNFIYDGSELIAEYRDDNAGVAGAMTNRYVYGFDTDEPVVSYAGSGTTDADRDYLISDDQGSIIAVTDNSGQVTGADTAINTYDAYGMPQGNNLGRFQYTGQAWLPEVGMYYYKARMYDPITGRFLQPDPIGYGDGMNMYTYVHDRPTEFDDPQGLSGSFTAGNGINCTFEHHYERVNPQGQVIMDYGLSGVSCDVSGLSQAAQDGWNRAIAAGNRWAATFFNGLKAKGPDGCSFADSMGDTLSDVSTAEGTAADTSLGLGLASEIAGGGPEDPVGDAAGGFFATLSESLNTQAILSGVGSAGWKYFASGDLSQAESVGSQILASRLYKDAQIVSGGIERGGPGFSKWIKSTADSLGGHAIDWTFSTAAPDASSNKCSAMKGH